MKYNLSLTNISEHHLSDHQYYRLSKTIDFYLLNGKPCCSIDNSELKKDQLVVIASCCKKAFAYSAFLALVDKKDIKRCPNCNFKINILKFQCLVHERKIDKLELEVAELRELVFNCMPTNK